MAEYSIVVPVFNEQESLEALFGELVRALDALPGSWEVVFVNDCSSDRSPELLGELYASRPEKVRIINLTRRGGQTNALRVGFEAAAGDVVVTLDADLQNDPADIARLLEKMAQGYDVVCGWRRDRKDPYVKRFLSKLGNIFQRLLTGTAIHDISCTLRAYRLPCVRQLSLTWEGQHRFIPLMLSKKGYTIGEIVSHHRARRFGISKYSHRRIGKVIIDFLRILFSGR